MKAIRPEQRCVMLSGRDLEAAWCGLRRTLPNPHDLDGWQYMGSYECADTGLQTSHFRKRQYPGSPARTEIVTLSPLQRKSVCKGRWVGDAENMTDNWVWDSDGASC